MRLQRLELFGFKSFADRKVLDFEQAFTGIVGPNGCGKSNVVDAIRWVLGEQRPTSMRGGEMVDVIFKGSVSRPAMSVAEVTMVLDNSEGTLEERGEQVSVTRRVYRSGDGEYLIDGDRVRLKDVRDMLYGTGLGSRGYSVLEQGKIDAVLSANAFDRRAIFEEAAGISRYRQRRRETESRLKRVVDDLLRLDDVVGELEKRQRSLKIQAGRARRFIEARDAWRIDGLRFARHQVHALEAEVAVATARLSEDEKQVEAHRRRRGAAEEDLVARGTEQESLASEIDRCAAESSHLAGEVRAFDERRTQLLARVAAWESSAREEEQRTAELAVKHEERHEERAELEDLLHELEGAAEEAEGRERELVGTLREARTAHREIRENSGKQNELVLHLLHERTSGRNRVQHLEEALAPLAERSRRADERRGEAAAHAEEARAIETASRGELGLHEEELRRLEEERATRETEVAAVTSRRRELDGRRVELELEGARLQSRVEALTDWGREREKLEGGARQVFEAVEEGDGPVLEGEIAGLFADHLRTETRYARALDAVLDGRAQALVVTGRADALSIVRWLKERKSGRLHLVLPAGFGTPAPVEMPPELLSAAGVGGRLLDVTRFDEPFADLARTLLADVVLVDDAERGLELALEFPALRFATPDGDVVDAGGFVGGHTETVQGAVGRRSFAAELEGRRRDITAELARCTEELVELRDDEARRRSEIDELTAGIERESEARARARGALETARARLSDLEGAVALSRRECEELDAERRRTEEELVSARHRLEEFEARFTVENARLAEVEERRRELEVRVEELARDEAHSRVEATGVGERLSAARGRLKELARAMGEIGEELERTRRMCAEHAASAVEGKAEAERLATERGEFLERRGALEERLAEMRRLERGGREAIDVLRRRQEEITEELEALLGTLAEERLEKQRREMSLDEIRRRAEEDFGIPGHALLEDFAPEEELRVEGHLAALASVVSELRESMERLGPVNLEAVEELEEVSERLEFLQTQRHDVAEARRSLIGTIEKLNNESRRLFVETFEAVREEFRVIFRQLFGGGRADINLVGEEDVLEAGIEITARPPGRETLPISLLSGGQRTLTALALLFAVFQTRPSPFCVLDEVDAALDDANIGRFLSLLRDSLGATQFIVVTHNKGTMAAGDVLYGVTMAVRGVSHVVSVELSDVDEFVPDATGSIAAGSGGAPSGNGGAGGNGSAGAKAGAEDRAEDWDEDRHEEAVVELIPHVPGAEAVVDVAATPVGDSLAP